MKHFLIIGKIGSAYGILGWNNINSYTEKKNNILQYIPWFIQHKNNWEKIFLEQKKISKNKIYVKIKNINNRNQAQKLVNKIIAIKKKTLPILSNFEYYWKDIISCNVFNEKKKFIGIVTKIIRSTLNDILIIQNNNIKNKKEILIPFIQNTFIKKIDILKKKIYIKTNL